MRLRGNYNASTKKNVYHVFTVSVINEFEFICDKENDKVALCFLLLHFVSADFALGKYKKICSSSKNVQGFKLILIELTGAYIFYY